MHLFVLEYRVHVVEELPIHRLRILFRILLVRDCDVVPLFGHFLRRKIIARFTHFITYFHPYLTFACATLFEVRNSFGTQFNQKPRCFRCPTVWGTCYCIRETYSFNKGKPTCSIKSIHTTKKKMQFLYGDSLSSSSGSNRSEW